MSSDYAFQSNFVIQNAWRLISLQDKDISSPSAGSFHYAYWRDKTSEFADARFQEAGATLGILSSKRYKQEHNNILPTKEILYDCFAAGLKNLSKLQYKDGSYDEWYKGERGFAATEFTCIAYGLAAVFLKDELKYQEKELLNSILFKSGIWLSKREDKIKSNHQAAAAAALALIWKITKDENFLNSAESAMDKTLIRQTEEGWFPEIGGMDLGYSSVLLDYCMIFTWITGDEKTIKPMKKLINFMFPHFHPDGTISPESGICLNPYVSRLGLILVSAYSNKASFILNNIQNNKNYNKVLEPYLADDLRFCRWSHLPLVSNILFKESVKDSSKNNEIEHFPKGLTLSKTSSIVSFHEKDTHIYFSISGGGVVRLFQGKNLIFEEIGILLNKKNHIWNTRGYKINREIYTKDNFISFEGDLHEANYAFPGFLARTILRILCINKYSSKITRQIIDLLRLKNGSAINQSAGSISRDKNKIFFKKSLKIDKNKFQLKYEIPIVSKLKERDEFIIDYFSIANSLNIYKSQNKIFIVIEFCLNEFTESSRFRTLKKLKDIN